MGVSPAIMHINNSARIVPDASTREPPSAEIANSAVLADPAIVYITKSAQIMPDASAREPVTAKFGNPAANPLTTQVALSYPAPVHPATTYPVVNHPAVPYPSVPSFAATDPVVHLATAHFAETHSSAGGLEMATSTMQQRQLARVQHKWQGETGCSAVQLIVEEGDFVNVWTQSITEQGWIYAESLIFGGNAGWLPKSMLQELSPNHRWMRASSSCAAAYDSQMALDVGNVVLIDIASNTGMWVYAVQPKSFGGEDGLPQQEGWVPISCLDWSQS